jgi:serine protease Do
MFFLLIKRPFMQSKKKIILPFFLLVLCLTVAMANPLAAQNVAASPPTGAPPSFADLADRLLPAVVNISTTQIVKPQRGMQFGFPEMPQFPPGSPFEDFFRDFFENMPQQRGGGDMPTRKSTSLGSGFIIDPSGLVVTNNHVIADADEIKVILHDDTELDAELVGRDSKMDLALLRVKPKKPLPSVPWGDSDAARVGDWVLAIGNPFGLGGTVTAGIISARARDINAGPYDDFLQTDASINRGNSGGPMFNMRGEVIGINTAIFSPSGGSVGIGFAIPAASAKSVIEQLQKFGKTKRGWLGVRIQGVNQEIADSLGLRGQPRGALVAEVTPKGPAVGKLQVGDIILRFNGRDINQMRELPRTVADTEIGREVDVTVWRKGREQSVRFAVGQLEDAEEASAIPTKDRNSRPDGKADAQAKILGLTLAPITGNLRQRFEIPKTVVQGAVITGVDGNSVAAELGLRPGDVLVQVDQTDVNSVDMAISLLEEAGKKGKKSVLLLLNRAGETRFVPLKIDEK